MSNQLIKESKEEVSSANPKIRIEIEPVEVWLDEKEGSLSLGALQAAFPGCSGLYYRENTDENNDTSECIGRDVNSKFTIGSKCAVKFDGRKFFPPKGHTRFFVSLGSSVPKFAMQNYENASKQFERSVALVQSMMITQNASKNNAHLPPKIDDESYDLRETKHLRHSTGKKSSASDDSGAEFSRYKESNGTEIIGDDNKVLQRLRELETQFAELAQISAGKDEIISTHRRNNEDLQSKLTAQQLRLSETLERLKEVDGKCAFQEEELEMLHSMSKEQDTMCMEINSLVKKLADLKRQSELKIAILESSVDQRNSQIQELVNRNNLLSATIGELRAKCAERKTQCEKLQKQKSEICEKFNAKSAQFLEKNANDENCRDELLADNLKMHEKNAELMREIKRIRKGDEIVGQKYFKLLRNILASETKFTEKELFEKVRNCLADYCNDAELVDTIEVQNTIEQQKNKQSEMSLKDQLFSYSFN